MARGFPFGPGGFGHGFGPGGPGGFGPGGPGGPGGFGPGMPPRGGRMFGRGNLKYVLLDLLQERPKHGYEMIKELEERSSGFYTPSAGAIYPTLQLLEDRSWVTTQTSEGKRVYAITDAGREALKQHQQESAEYAGPRGWGERGEHHGHGRGHGGPFGGGPFGREARPELDAIRREGMGVTRLMRAAVLASGGDTQRLAQLRAIVERTRDDLNAFLGQPTAQPSAQPNANPDEPTPSATTTDGPVEQL